MSDKKLSPEEYAEIVKHFVNKTSPPAPKKIKLDDTLFCYHNFKLYKGLNVVYEFCDKCEVKREMPKEIADTDWNSDNDGSFQEVVMCIMCADWIKLLTVKEKLNGLNEIISTETIDEEHVAYVYEKLLKEYADEISKEVMEKTK